MDINVHNIDVKYEGKYLRIGVSTKTRDIYYQCKTTWDTNLWIRFTKEQYDDYTEFLKRYDNE